MTSARCRSGWLVGCCALWLGACSDERGRPATPQRSASRSLSQGLVVQEASWEAASGSASPRLQTGADGEISASWLETQGDGARLRWRPVNGDERVQAETVVEGSDLLQNWADTPAVVAMSAETRLALWPALHPGEGGQHPGYGLRFAMRADGRWGIGAALPLDDTGPEYGFVSTAPLGEERTAVFWLDGRSSQGHHGGQMQLRSAVVTPQGVVDRRLVDARVCDCCQTSAAVTPSGPVVAYRDRGEDEVRDIWLAGPGANQRRRVGADNWTIEGCPVNGPAVVARGSTVAVAWFTAQGDRPRVQAAFAAGDAAFGPAISIAVGDTLGRVDAVWIDGGVLAVSWIDKTTEGAEIRVRTVTSQGQLGQVLRVAPTTSDRRAGFPQVENAGDGRLWWAWTSAPEGAPSRVRFASTSVDDLVAASALGASLR